MTGKLLTIMEAAEALGRSRGFVTALMADGLVGARKIRGRWYIDRGDLDAWIQAGRVNPDPGRIVVPNLGWGPDRAA